MSLSTLNFVILFVENPQKSCTFYKEILKVEPVEQAATFVMFVLQNGISLGLWSKYTCEPSVFATAGGSEIGFCSHDVDRVYAEWEKLHVTIAQKPCDMDFGRTFVALDPDGHRIRVYRLFE